MNVSPIAEQINSLREVLWDQKAPNLLQGFKCCAVLERLQNLIFSEKREGILDLKDLNHVCTVLTDVKHSFVLGAERVNCKDKSFRFFNPVWNVANIMRDRILTDYWRAMLDLWLGLEEEGENRHEAVERILRFLSDKSRTELDLSGLKLKELPDIFRGDFVDRLFDLYLSENSLPVLPEGIGRLKNLKKLSLCSNRFEVLPESMKNLNNLKDLYASGNKLTGLSPVIMKGLGNLETLDVSYNDYISLSGDIENLRKLKNLYIEGNCLTTLPESIGRLVNLRVIDASYNSSLVSLPNTVFQLSSTCELDIQNCGFSDRIIADLRSIISAPSYRGPRISFYAEDANFCEAKTLEEVLKDLSEIAARQVTFSRDLMDASQKSLVAIWLNRICEIVDYQNSSALKEQITNQVLDYLEEIVANEEFRDAFYRLINSSIEAHRDRVALSLLYIGLAYNETKIDLRDTQNLAQFLIRGVFVMSILEDVARAKIPTLKFVNEIEIYLGYPILLKERLQIPINVGKTLYPGCAELTDQDVSNAETYVKEQIENKDAVCNFLVDHPRWQKALESSFPAETTKLKAERMTKLEEDFSQLIKIEVEYENALKNLTNKLINWESLS